MKLTISNIVENSWWKTRSIENNGKKIEEGFLHGKIIVTTIFTVLLDLYFVRLGSVSGWSAHAQWASRSLMGWKFDRLGDDFPPVSANWLRSKLVIDWQTRPWARSIHSSCNASRTLLADARRSRCWNGLYIYRNESIYSLLSALFPSNGIASRVGEWYIRPLVSYQNFASILTFNSFYLRPLPRDDRPHFLISFFHNFRNTFRGKRALERIRIDDGETVR